MKLKPILLGTMLSALSLNALALTDMEATDLGYTLESEFLMSEMKSVLTPGLNSEGVEEAVRNHRLVIAINKANKGSEAQTLRMFENGVEILKTKVSTGKEERVKSASGRVYISTTPKGFFRPTKVYRDYLSYTWNAPMPNAVFFIGGIAIHATGPSNYAALGKRASGGCVRVKQEISKEVREKVMETGRGSSVGDYKVIAEAKGRNRIGNNTVKVPQLARDSGNLLQTKVDSWDTVIIVYEE